MRTHTFRLWNVWNTSKQNQTQHEERSQASCDTNCTGAHLRVQHPYVDAHPFPSPATAWPSAACQMKWLQIGKAYEDTAWTCQKRLGTSHAIRWILYSIEAHNSNAHTHTQTLTQRSPNLRLAKVAQRCAGWPESVIFRSEWLMMTWYTMIRHHQANIMHDPHKLTYTLYLLSC